MVAIIGMSGTLGGDPHVQLSPRPVDRSAMELDRRLARQVAPFGAVALLGFALVPIHNPVEWTGYALAAALTVAVACMSVLAPWRRLPRVARIAPSLLFLVALALLRTAGGGAVAGVGALALLPVFWLALHGSRAELLVIIGSVCAFFLAPALLIGGSEYPISNWRTGVVFAAGAAIVGITVQTLVARVRSHAEALAVRERDLEAMADLARTLSGSTDARERICAAACDLGDAHFAVLLEGQGDGTLARTAEAGLSLDAEPGEGLETSAAAVLFEPVLHGDEAAGVLVVGWRQPPPDPRRTTGLIRLLAAEAAFAIERADLLGRLTEIALTDELTGLPNRRAWDKRLAQAIRDAEQVCVAILDLDLFKSFNDDHGHQAGDRLLKEAAAAWRAELRPSDMLARYGGEEFVVLLRQDDLEVARRVVDRLRAATPRDQACSAGIARPRAGEDATALLARADEALYAAKRAGRDRSLIAS
jgi:diguanylate cyclase (GGDEF)-like protein